MPLKDKDKRKEYLKQWTAQNKEKCKQYGYKYLENNPKKKLLKSSKANAKHRGLEHSIFEEDISIPTHCPYLGIELSSTICKKNSPNTVSIDRIDSSKGYIKGNIQVISNLANLMKSFATEEQLLTFAQNVLKIHGNNQTPNKSQAL